MPKAYDAEKAYQALTDGPVTVNEIAKRLGISHKTAKEALMYLALTRKDVKYRNSGRIHLFWKRGEFLHEF